MRRAALAGASPALLRPVAAAVAALALIAALLAAASPAVGAQGERAARRLEQQLGARGQAYAHRATGRVRFVGTLPRRPLPRPAGVAPGAPARSVARAFLAAHGAAFGVRDPARDLALMRVSAGPRGSRAVRWRQRHAGIPVVGGELIVNVDADGRVLSAGGELVPPRDLERVGADPRIPAATAAEIARATVARAHGVAPEELTVAPPTLEIYDPRLLGAPGLPEPRLVWRTEVAGGDLGEIRELALVDALAGVVALHFNQVAHAKQRAVCDAANVRGARLPCLDPVLSEGESTAGREDDVVRAYEYAGDTYDFFFDRFGRDSLDGRGLPLRSTVRYCTIRASDRCPYPNAFWNGAQMAYGVGMVADDVVGHELAHGVTDYTAGLFYYFQSGAINESLSDVFGELIDLANGAGTDTPESRWLIGEDVATPVPGFPVPLRDMADPPRFGDPDRMTSDFYFGGEIGGMDRDNGGVHINSGVNNKAAFLLTDGGDFNGETVVGLGEDKVARLYYTVATTLLTSGSDYADLAAALRQACANLVGSHGFVAADCDQVDAAIRAVEMEVDPPAAPAPHAPVCDAGQPFVSAYHDDFSNPSSGRWAVQALLGRAEWYYAGEPNPHDFDARYSLSGTGNLWGYDRAGTGDYAIAMTGDVIVPHDGWMRFVHAYGFDDEGEMAYDGGVLEYSLNGGATWHDAGPLMSDVGYSGIIAQGQGNPLDGRSAFVRESNGYRATRVDLRSLAGRPIRFRFRIGTDPFLGADDYGWFIDSVRVYGCSAPPPSDDPPAPPPDGGPRIDTDDRPASAQARVVSKRVRVRRGRVRIVVRCQTSRVARCRGTLRIGPRGRFGAAAVNVRAGKRAAVTVRLTRAARRALARKGRLRATAVVRTRNPGARDATHRAGLLMLRA